MRPRSRRAARARGLIVDGLHRECAVYAASPPGLVLGYGAIAEPAIGAAIRELADAVDQPGV